VNIDPEKRPQGFSAADFMPGAVVKSERDELIEWAEQVISGESFEEPDPEELRRFQTGMRENFNLQ